MRQTIPLHCPSCAGSVFNAAQEFDEQNHRCTIKLTCPTDGTIIYADTVIELSTKFPEKK